MHFVDFSVRNIVKTSHGLGFCCTTAWHLFQCNRNYSLRGSVTKTNDIHPVLPIICFVMLGMTIGTAVAMEKLPFSPTSDNTEIEAEDLLPRGSGSLRPDIDAK